MNTQTFSCSLYENHFRNYKGHLRSVTLESQATHKNSSGFYFHLCAQCLHVTSFLNYLRNRFGPLINSVEARGTVKTGGFRRSTCNNLRCSRIPIRPPILGGTRNSFVKKLYSLYSGSGKPGNWSRSSLCPDQVLLSKNFHSRPGCRQKSLVRNSGVRGGVKIGSSLFPSLRDMISE